MDRVYNETTEFEKKPLISDFNEAKYQILRLNYSWTLCNSYRRIGNMLGWKWELHTIWDELSSKAEKKDKTFYFAKVDELDKLIIKAEEEKSPNKLYNALRELHRFLKHIQDAVGMGGKFKREDEDDLEE